MNKSQKLELMVMRAKMHARKSWDKHIEDWFATPDAEFEPKRGPQPIEKVEEQDANTQTGI